MYICSVSPPPELWQQQQPEIIRKPKTLELPPGNRCKDSTISAVKVQMSHRQRRRRQQVGRSDLLRRCCVRAENQKTRKPENKSCTRNSFSRLNILFRTELFVSVGLVGLRVCLCVRSSYASTRVSAEIVSGCHTKRVT